MTLKERQSKALIGSIKHWIKNYKAVVKAGSSGESRGRTLKYFGYGNLTDSCQCCIEFRNEKKKIECDNCPVFIMSKSMCCETPWHDTPQLFARFRKWYLEFVALEVDYLITVFYAMGFKNKGEF